MAAFDIFNPAKLPKLLDNPSTDELEVLMQYGNKQIKNLSSQYQGTVDSIQDCLDEWSSSYQNTVLQCVRFFDALLPAIFLLQDDVMV